MINGYSVGICQGGPSMTEWVVPALVGAAGTTLVVDGAVTVHVTSSSRAATYDDGHPNGPGWFERPLSALDVGPVLLVPPALSGGTAVGDSVGFEPAIWLAKDAAVAVTFTLEADSGGGFAPLTGYQDTSYASAAPLTITAAEEGAALRLTETAVDARGSASASAEIAATAPPETPPMVIQAAREYSRDIGVVSEDVSGLYPAPSGMPSYELVSQTAGVALTGSVLEIDTAVVTDGTQATVRRTDGNDTHDLVTTITIVVGDVTITNGTASLTYGANDPADTAYAGTFLGGAYDGVVWSFTKTEIESLANGTGHPLVLPEAPVIQTDADGDGKLDIGDQIAPGRAGVWAYPAGNTPPTITISLRDQSGELLPSFTATYTIDGSETGAVFARETDGTTTVDSTAIEVAAPPAVADTFTVTDYTAIKAYVGESGLPWSYQGGGADTVNGALIDPSTNRLRANGSNVVRLYSQGAQGSFTDQSAKATLRRGTAVTDLGVFPAVRISGGNGYWVSYSSVTDAFQLHKMVAGTITDIGAQVPNGNFGFAASGATITAEVRALGNTISLHLNGSEVASVTDTDIASGQPGIAAKGNTTSATELDDFTGEAL